MGLLLLAAASCALIVTSVLTVTLLGVTRRGDAVLSVGVLAVSLVVVDSLALGAVHLFSRWFLLGLAAAQLLAAAVLVAARPAARERIGSLPGGLRAGFGDLSRALRQNPFAAILTVTVALLFTWRVFVAAATGVQDYDGLSYHMSMVMSWVQDHRVGQRIPLNMFADAYPGNLELQAAWAMAISGTAKYAGLTQAPFAVIGWVTVVALGRRCGLPRGWAVAAAGLFCVMPTVLIQVGLIYNDLAATAMFIAGMHLAGRAADHLVSRRSWFSYGLLAGVALGFTAGTKPGFVFGALVATLLLVVAAWRRTRSWRRPLTVLATLLVPLALIGAPFYLRNIVVLGNPLAPFALQAGPISLPGALDLDQTVIVPSMPPEIRHLGPLITPVIWFGYQVDLGYMRLQNNFGVQWPLLLLPALVGWLGLLILRKRTWYYATVLVPMAAVFFSHPTPWIFRYVMFIVAPAAVALCLGLRWLANRPHRAGLVASGAICLLALACIPGTLTFYYTVRTGHPGITAVRLLPAHQLVREVAAGTPLQIYDQPGVKWLQGLPDGTRIGVANRSRGFPAPLYGVRAQYRVIRLSPEPEDTALELDRQRIDYLFLIEGDPTTVWVQQHHDRFTLVSRTGNLLAYRVGDQQRSRTD